MARNKLTRSARVLSDQVIEKYYKQKQYEVAEGMETTPSTLSRFISNEEFTQTFNFIAACHNLVFLIRIRTLRLRKVNLKCYSLRHKALISGYVRSIWVNKKATRKFRG